MKRILCMIAAALLLVTAACAEEYVSVVELRQQAEEAMNEGWVLIPEVEKVPVLTVRTDGQVKENSLCVKVGEFDENHSGRFLRCVRYGKTPSHTALNNGLTLEAAQTILDEELGRLVNKSIEDYGLIWTEIAEWKNMETWLLYYGQRFAGLTCFSAGMTMDARTPDYHYLIIPNYEQKEMLCEDVPLASWTKVKASVDACLSENQPEKVDALELGYWIQENGDEGILIPVWRLAFTASKGYKECYFRAQTGEPLDLDHVGTDFLSWENISK